MTESEATTELEQKGFSDVHIVRMDAGTHLGQHTHDQITAHIILAGELFITDEDGTKVYEKGDRIEFSAGTTHSAAVGAEPFIMAVGTK